MTDRICIIKHNLFSQIIMSKVSFKPYTKKFKKVFGQTKQRIKKVLPDAVVEHIGSTAVQGLKGKGIVDILIGIDSWDEKMKAVRGLKSLGFSHVHSEEDGRIFLSKKAETDYGDTHLHLVKRDGEEFKEKVKFRDFLREHPEKAQEYENIKRKAIKKSKGDRKQYGEVKENFIKKIISQMDS